uniref:Butyrophilin subfamily 1 member A1-like n=1 Tax=Geotrypetes seraphini TaxID=260995 RepID=A0A6P8N6K4_GEOSA|nr:butyrophilin subfamily 1 member A1-like [Geotrypetes seraphini]
MNKVGRCFLHFLLLLSLVGPSSGESFKLIGPDHPVVAILGEDAVLPLCLTPPISTENIEVRWFRTTFSSPVYLYEYGRDQNEHQLPEFQGRTELIRDHMARGNMALKIHNVTLYDEGRYTCFVRLGSYYQDKELELKVTGLGNSPQISWDRYQDGRVTVLCESTGWYPEPEVIWRQDKQSLTPFSKTETSEQNGLVNVKSSLSVTINKSSDISCCVRNIILSQERESTISPSDLTNIKNRPSYARTLIFTSVVTVVIISGFYLAVVYCIRLQYIRILCMKPCIRKAENEGELQARDERTCLETKIV